MIVGRLSICWRCGAIFEIMRKSLRSKKLHCENCTRGKYNKAIERMFKEDKILDHIDKILRITKDDNTAGK